MLNNYLCALDIGSSKLSACVAEIKKGQIQRVFFESLPCAFVKEGIAVDSIGLVGSIGKLLGNLRSKSGINIKYLHTNISGKDIVTKHSHAIVPLAERGNKVITASDIQMVNEQARILGSSLEEEIIHQIPSDYTIDAKNNILNPLGLYSHRLEVDLYLVCAKLSSVQSLSRAVNQSGYEIKDLWFSGLATSKAVFNPNELKNGINIFCDIGSDITELLIFDKGVLKEVQILPIGGDDLTRRLSRELKVTFELAEEIKVSHGVIGDPQHIPEDKEILVRRSGLYKPIRQRLVTEILSEQAKALCSSIKSTLEKKAPSYEIDNFIVAGRSALLEGMIESLENVLSIPVKLARINESHLIQLAKENSFLSARKYLTFLTCLGMVCSELQEKPAGVLPVQHATKNLLLKAVNRFKETYQE
ncbi:MAG TPA: cell division protein FtsA, partial [Candidatus Margulisiibacteriota bacterium]|nr:cell division protein FtsA [Candidatus Margulisiibacteriota bacterium]